MPIITKTFLLLLVSNFFMLCAWYVHLRYLGNKAWYIAAFLSWCIAFFEYTVHIPAIRIGKEALTLSQLHILQIAMSLAIFIPFSIVIMKNEVKWDYVYAALCLTGAAYFIFR